MVSPRQTAGTGTGLQPGGLDAALKSQVTYPVGIIRLSTRQEPPLSHPLAIVRHSGSRCLLHLERGAAKCWEPCSPRGVKTTQLRTVQSAR